MWQWRRTASWRTPQWRSPGWWPHGERSQHLLSSTRDQNQQRRKRCRQWDWPVCLKKKRHFCQTTKNVFRSPDGFKLDSIPVVAIQCSSLLMRDNNCRPFDCKKVDHLHEKLNLNQLQICHAITITLLLKMPLYFVYLKRNSPITTK